MQFELAARLRDQIVTVHQMQDKQRIATADNEDADVFGFHYENEMLAVNLFHMRGGKIVDRRDFFWEDLPEFAAESLADHEADRHASDRRRCSRRRRVLTSPRARSAAPGAGDRSRFGGPRHRHHSRFGADAAEPCRSAAACVLAGGVLLCAAEAALSRSALCAASRSCAGGVPRPRAAGRAAAERTGTQIEIVAPQRGEKRSLVDLVCQNAKQSYDQRFRVLQPSMKAIQEALQDALTLGNCPSASSASTSRTSRARRRSPRWWCGRTAR